MQNFRCMVDPLKITKDPLSSRDNNQMPVWLSSQTHSDGRHQFCQRLLQTTPLSAGALGISAPLPVVLHPRAEQDQNSIPRVPWEAPEPALTISLYGHPRRAHSRNTLSARLKAAFLSSLLVAGGEALGSRKPLDSQMLSIKPSLGKSRVPTRMVSCHPLTLLNLFVVCLF